MGNWVVTDIFIGSHRLWITYTNTYIFAITNTDSRIWNDCKYSLSLPKDLKSKSIGPKDKFVKDPKKDPK